MKVAIVGTSNSLLKDGWVKYYRELNKDVQIDNYSLGANTSLYGHYILEKKRILEEYDYCIVDFAVNDQANLDLKLISEELLMASYLDLIRKFKYSRCIPVFIILPIIPYWQNPESCIVRKIIIYLCQKFGVMYIDVYDFFSGLSDDFAEECLFRDYGHISSFAAKCLALQLLSSLKEQAKNIFIHKLNMDIPCFNFRIKHWKEIEYSNCKQLLQETSIAHYSVIHMSAESGSQINLYGQDLLCAVFFWDTNKTNYVYFSTDKGIVRKSLTPSCANHFFLRQFITPVRSHDGIIEVRIAAKDGFIHERTNECEPQFNSELELEVIDFLVCDKSYEDKIDILQNFLTKSCAWTIRHADYQQYLKQSYIKVFSTLDQSITDDIMRYKKEIKEAKKEVVVVMRNILSYINDNSRQFIIFGAGKMGKTLIESLFADVVTVVVDNDCQKWNSIFCGYTIFNPNEILKFNKRIILIASMHFDDVKRQLIEMGLTEDKDFFDGRPLYKILC